MYDSRSSHARRPQHADTLSAFFVRTDRDRDTVEWMGRRLKGRNPALTDQQAIAEGLADYAEMNPRGGYDHVEPLDFHHLPGLSGIGRDRTMEGYEALAADPDMFRTPRRPERKARKALISAGMDLDERFQRRAAVIALVGRNSKRRAAKRPISRLTAPAFDPTLVSRTLSPAGVR